jgi:hypothetical protein
VGTSEDFTTKLMNDMDPALLDFVKNKVTSFIKWEILRFLHENPNTVDSAENIAHYTGRNADAVQRELDELVESQVLEKRTLNRGAPAPRVAYSLIQDRDTRQLVAQFIQACEDRRFRVKAVYHIIKSM